MDLVEGGEISNLFRSAPSCSISLHCIPLGSFMFRSHVVLCNGSCNYS